ncbi:MAG: methyltransferase, partial [Candidatus Aenigmatarchaeota archaeon]
AYNCKEILEGKKFISFDLGISKEKVEIREKGVLIRDCLVSLEKIKKIANDSSNSIYCLENGEIKKILFFEKNVYKLRLVKPNTAPTLEINGIHMHRIKGITPWEDSKIKVSCVNVKNRSVLDICTGLGYTAILAKKFGCKEVITIEKDENVLKVAEYNPWSKELENIEIINEDAFYALEKIDRRFDVIIFDPPRFSLAPELYSKEFYSILKGKLNPNGKIFHYVGDVWIKKGKTFWKEIRNRLKNVGFKNIKYKPNAKGIVANV